MDSTLRTSPSTEPDTLAFRLRFLEAFFNAARVRVLPGSSNFRNLPLACFSPNPDLAHDTTQARGWVDSSLSLQNTSTTTPENVSAEATVMKTPASRRNGARG